jgi:hypothetical protein
VPPLFPRVQVLRTHSPRGEWDASTRTALTPHLLVRAECVECVPFAQISDPSRPDNRRLDVVQILCRHRSCFTPPFAQLVFLIGLSNNLNVLLWGAASGVPPKCRNLPHDVSWGITPDIPTAPANTPRCADNVKPEHHAFPLMPCAASMARAMRSDVEPSRLIALPRDASRTRALISSSVSGLRCAGVV